MVPDAGWLVGDQAVADLQANYDCKPGSWKREDGLIEL
jgi:hypothetical protein